MDRNSESIQLLVESTSSTSLLHAMAPIQLLRFFRKLLLRIQVWRDNSPMYRKCITPLTPYRTLLSQQWKKSGRFLSRKNRKNPPGGARAMQSARQQVVTAVYRPVAVLATRHTAQYAVLVPRPYWRDSDYPSFSFGRRFRLFPV